jgi:DNA-binding response OmpR family regulator
MKPGGEGSPMKVRIAVLDPVMRTREYGRRAVLRLGHEAVAFANLDEMARAGRLISPPDMLILAGTGDAGSFVAQVRQVKAFFGDWVPVLCLASRRQLPGLADLHWDAANEVVASPNSFVELCCLARMFMQRFGVSVRESEPAWDGYRFSLTSDAVEVSGQTVRLRPLEFDLALELFCHAGQTLARERLYSVVWDRNEDTASRSLDVTISRLRQALKLAANGWNLRVVWGLGYRLEKAIPPA